MKLEKIENLVYLVRVNCTDTIENLDGTLDFGGLASHEIVSFSDTEIVFDNGLKFTPEELEAEAMRQNKEHFDSLAKFLNKQ